MMGLAIALRDPRHAPASTTLTSAAWSFLGLAKWYTRAPWGISGRRTRSRLLSRTARPRGSSRLAVRRRVTHGLKSLAPALAPLLTPLRLGESQHYCTYGTAARDQVLHLPAVLARHVDAYWHCLHTGQP